MRAVEPEDALLSVWNLLGYAHLAPALLVGTEDATRIDLFISVAYQTLSLCYHEHLPLINEGWGTLASRQLTSEGLGQWTDSPSGCLKRKHGSKGLCQRLMQFHERVVASLLGVSLVGVEILTGPYSPACLGALEGCTDRCMLDSYPWKGGIALIKRSYSAALAPSPLTRALLRRNRIALAACSQEPTSHVIILPDED